MYQKEATKLVISKTIRKKGTSVMHKRNDNSPVLQIMDAIKGTGAAIKQHLPVESTNYPYSYLITWPIRTSLLLNH